MCPSVLCVLVKRIVVQMHCRMQMHCKQLLKKKPQELRSKPFRSFSEAQLWQSPCWHHFDDTMAIPQLGTCNLISFFYLLQPSAFLCLLIIRKCISFSILSLQWWYLQGVWLMIDWFRYALRKKNDIIWELFPNIGPPPPFGNPLSK